MPALEPPDILADPLPAEFAELGVFASRAEAEEHGLVILALGRPYWLLARDSRWALVVEADIAAPARRHLEKYARERLRWPPLPIADPWVARRADLLTPMLWAALVLALHAFAPGAAPRFALDSVAMVQRAEWWRAFTALFLHGSAAHVISNALGGLLVFTATVSTLGRARGWLLVGLAATAANAALALAHYPELHRSLGASTAIFAAVGLLTGRAINIVARSQHPHRWRALFIPAMAGGTVLAMHGAGGENVDLGAHVFGFAAGLIAGVVAGLAPLRSKPAQTF